MRFTSAHNRPGATASRPLYLGLICVFVLSRAVYWMLGVRFDSNLLVCFWQYLDPGLLRERLAESLWYLHGQPPGFNLLLGLILQAFPTRYGLAFQGLYLLGGLALYLGTCWLMLRLGVSRALAVTISTLFMLSPSYVLYENWIFYTFPVCVLLTLSAVVLERLLHTERRRYAFAFFGLILLVCLSQSLFHIGYYLLVTLLVVTAARRPRRVLPAAVLPFVLLAAVYAKNYALFGRFTASTWLGMNVGKVVDYVPLEQRRQLVAEGSLSPVALVPPFAPLERYPADLRQVPEGAPPVLAQATTRLGCGNYNHVAYVAISDHYLRDSLAIARLAPAAFARKIADAWRFYFWSSSDYFVFEEQAEVSREARARGDRGEVSEEAMFYQRSAANKRVLAPFDTLYNRLFYGRVDRNIPFISIRGRLYILLSLGIPLVTLYAAALAARGRMGSARLDRYSRAMLAYYSFNIVYVAAAANFIEVGENHRIRFVTDPFLVILLALALQNLPAAWAAKRRGDARTGASTTVGARDAEPA